MELWRVIFGGVGGIAGGIALIYAHIAYRSSKESGRVATGANTLARDSNEIAKDAKRLAEEANEISHRSERRDTERHDVNWEGDWRKPGVYVMVKRGHHEARAVVATVTFDGEEQTQRAEVISEEMHALEFSFPNAAVAFRRELAEDLRRKESAATHPSYMNPPAMPVFHFLGERVEWSTIRGAPKLHLEDSGMTTFSQFLPLFGRTPRRWSAFIR